jgi:hypothetical protein
METNTANYNTTMVTEPENTTSLISSPSMDKKLGYFHPSAILTTYVLKIYINLPLLPGPPN